MNPQSVVFGVVKSDGDLCVWFANLEAFNRASTGENVDDVIDSVSVEPLCERQGYVLNEIESGADGISNEYVVLQADRVIPATPATMEQLSNILKSIGFTYSKAYEAWATDDGVE